MQAIFYTERTTIEEYNHSILQLRESNVCATFTDTGATWILNFQGPEPLRSLANIYRAVTLSVGCSQQTCNDKATAVCFFSKPELRNGQLIYRAGTPCKSDQECTTYPRSTCNVTETLCHAQSFETVPAGANNQCSNNTGMTDSLREKFLKMHNYRRSNMALGKVEKFNGKFFPKAANMEKMEYDCELEADAMIYAETCALGPSYPGTRKDQGENVAVVEPQSAESFDKAAQWAMRSWFKPIKEDGSIGIKEVTFKEKHRYTPVAGATQVVWSTTNKVGCAIGKCGDVYFTVCRYSPAGNQVDHEVYKKERRAHNVLQRDVTLQWDCASCRESFLLV
ncbi:SCP-like protein [Ostertagia ostertagi]